MGIDDSSLTTDGTGDSFLVGQEKEAVPILADPKKSDGITPNWDESFLRNIHGVILITGESDETIRKKKDEIEQIFNSNISKSINEIISIFGSRLEGDLSAHEQSVFVCHLRYKIIKLNLDSVLAS